MLGLAPPEPACPPIAFQAVATTVLALLVHGYSGQTAMQSHTDTETPPPAPKHTTTTNAHPPKHSPKHNRPAWSGARGEPDLSPAALNATRKSAG